MASVTESSPSSLPQNSYVAFPPKLAHGTALPSARDILAIRLPPDYDVAFVLDLLEGALLKTSDSVSE